VLRLAIGEVSCPKTQSHYRASTQRHHAPGNCRVPRRMARYRKIDTRIWNDAKFNALSERAKLAFFYALTHPNLTMLGAMRATVPGLAAELGMPPGAFAEAFREALAKGMAKHDEKSSFFWLPNFLRYNKPESPNVVKSWPDAFDLLPECAMKSEMFEQLKAFTEGMTKGFNEAFAEAFPKPFAKTMPNQEPEPEPEQEQEQEQGRTSPSCPQEESQQRSHLDAFLAAWNENRGTLSKVLALTDARRGKIRTRIRGGLTIERFTEAVKLCATTRFLTGCNDRKWQASFDWLTKNDSNLLKVLEGQYADSDAKANSSMQYPSGFFDDSNGEAPHV
jgi:hypothetical protein